MFTGIIRDTGRIEAMEEIGEKHRIRIASSETPKTAQIGSSICVSGTCLTVVELSDTGFAFDVMDQTLRLTTMGEREVGDSVNLEGSMRVGDEVGGHFVYGHVDGVAKITRIEREGDSVIMTFEPPRHLMKYLGPQGSVTLDGISLTVANLRDSDFDVSLIDHTMKETTLSDRQVGDGVNMEADMMMKYLDTLLESREKQKGA